MLPALDADRVGGVIGRLSTEMLSMAVICRRSCAPSTLKARRVATATSFTSPSNHTVFPLTHPLFQTDEQMVWRALFHLQWPTEWCVQKNLMQLLPPPEIDFKCTYNYDRTVWDNARWEQKNGGHNDDHGGDPVDYSRTGDMRKCGTDSYPMPCREEDEKSGDGGAAHRERKGKEGKDKYHKKGDGKNT